MPSLNNCVRNCRTHVGEALKIDMLFDMQYFHRFLIPESYCFKDELDNDANKTSTDEAGMFFNSKACLISALPPM